MWLADSLWYQAMFISGHKEILVIASMGGSSFIVRDIRNPGIIIFLTVR